MAVLALPGLVEDLKADSTLELLRCVLIDDETLKLQRRLGDDGLGRGRGRRLLLFI
jgi:hypothetical protein